jgi:hypothetical protein
LNDLNGKGGLFQKITVRWDEHLKAGDTGPTSKVMDAIRQIGQPASGGYLQFPLIDMRAIFLNSHERHRRAPRYKTQRP